MTLIQLFDLSLRGRRNETALEFQGREFTFGEIEARSNRLANLLLARFKAGDRLCVYLANCVEMVDLYLACVKLGIVFVPINILYRDREIAHIVSDAEPVAVLRTKEAYRRSGGYAGDTPGGGARWRYARGHHLHVGHHRPSKGAVLTHNNFAANAVNLLTCWQIAAADRLLLALPLFHVHGLGNGLHCWLMSGCRMRLLEKFDRQTAAAEFLDFKPTLFFGVPTVYRRLLEIPEEQAARSAASCGCLSRGRLHCPRKCSKRSASTSATRSSNATG